MTKIYITGDIHGDPFRFSTKKFPEGKELTKEDYVIVAGDFGIVWKNNPGREEQYKLKWLRDKPWTTLFVDGNHENHERLDILPIEGKFGGKVGVVCQDVYHLKRGEIYQIGGKSFFTFGGACSTDKESRTIGVSWWDRELPSYAEMDYGLGQLERVQYSVDYIITHTIPRSLIGVLGFSKRPIEGDDPTIKYLDHIAHTTTFKKWYFGHMHVDRDMGKFRALYEYIAEIM